MTGILEREAGDCKQGVWYDKTYRDNKEAQTFHEAQKMATDLSPAPTLQDGARMTRADFIALWEQIPELKFAELIGGVVHMPSPVTMDHGDQENDAGGWTYCYKVATPGCASGNNATTYLLEDATQPDVNLRLLPEYGGKSWVEDKYLHGSPELFVETSLSSEAHDLGPKLALYEEAGVQEYLVILMERKEIRWHQLVNGKYELVQPDAEGVWRSLVFPGLWLHGKAMLDGNAPQVVATLQRGLASEEHQRFVEELAKRKRK
jgi:Uma2 family endonuclease